MNSAQFLCWIAFVAIIMCFAGYTTAEDVNITNNFTDNPPIRFATDGFSNQTGYVTFVAGLDTAYWKDQWEMVLDLDMTGVAWDNEFGGLQVSAQTLASSPHGGFEMLENTVQIDTTKVNATKGIKLSFPEIELHSEEAQLGYTLKIHGWVHPTFTPQGVSFTDQTMVSSVYKGVAYNQTTTPKTFLPSIPFAPGFVPDNKNYTNFAKLEDEAGRHFDRAFDFKMSALTVKEGIKWGSQPYFKDISDQTFIKTIAKPDCTINNEPFNPMVMDQSVMWFPNRYFQSNTEMHIKCTPESLFLRSFSKSEPKDSHFVIWGEEKCDEEECPKYALEYSTFTRPEQVVSKNRNFVIIASIWAVGAVALFFIIFFHQQPSKTQNSDDNKQALIGDNNYQAINQ